MSVEQDAEKVYEFVNLELSLDEISDIARKKGIPCEIRQGATGRRELWLDWDRVLAVSNMVTGIWETKHPDGTERVSTFRDFLPAINKLLGPGE